MDQDENFQRVCYQRTNPSKRSGNSAREKVNTLTVKRIKSAATYHRSADRRVDNEISVYPRSTIASYRIEKVHTMTGIGKPFKYTKKSYVYESSPGFNVFGAVVAVVNKLAGTSVV